MLFDPIRVWSIGLDPDMMGSYIRLFLTMYNFMYALHSPEQYTWSILLEKRYT